MIYKINKIKTKIIFKLIRFHEYCVFGGFYAFCVIGVFREFCVFRGVFFCVLISRFSRFICMNVFFHNFPHLRFSRFSVFWVFLFFLGFWGFLSFRVLRVYFILGYFSCFLDFSHFPAKKTFQIAYFGMKIQTS